MVYQHYQKDVSSKKVLSAKSAQSNTCKKSVHVQEVVRRLLNSSSRLEWKQEVAPVITEYMRRMKEGGYNENYRKSTLKHAIRIYEKMKSESENGLRPLYRPKEWQQEEEKTQLGDKRRLHSPYHGTSNTRKRAIQHPEGGSREGGR